MTLVKFRHLWHRKLVFLRYMYTAKNEYLIATAQPLLLEHMIQFVNTIS